MLNEVGKKPTQTESLNCLVCAVALETGFFGDWHTWCKDDDLETYQLHWSYSFDRKMLEDFSQMPQTDLDDDMTFKFKLSLRPEKQIGVQTFRCGDLFMITAHLIEKNSVMISTRSLALLASRYVIYRKLNSNLPINFRHLRELSIKVKNEIFLPLRNSIFLQLPLTMPYPSLQGLNDDSLLYILRYLPKKDVKSIAATCKSLRSIAFPYLCRNKVRLD